MSEYTGIRKLTEPEAALLFETPEFTTVGNAMLAHFNESDRLAAGARDLKRGAERAWLMAKALEQAQGGRTKKVEGNMLMAQGAAEDIKGELETSAGEALWAELALKNQLYVPHGVRLEAVATDRFEDGLLQEDAVYCWDITQQSMCVHKMNACPQTHAYDDDPQATVLRRRSPAGRLEPVTGRGPRHTLRGGG